jgi:hypothetical protein
MPFRFHLKRQRRYEVSSRKSYVVCVRLLNNKLLECTLTADSTGYDCLENIAQRIELNEVGRKVCKSDSCVHAVCKQHNPQPISPSTRVRR